MTIWKKLFWGGAGIGALFGRRPLAATYERGIQHATDVYIKAWGVVGVLFCMLAINAVLMMWEMRGMQTMLILVSFVVGMYYLFTPKIAIPLTGVGAVVRAGEPGDQPNIWLARDGFKDLVNNAGVVFFWLGVYILSTIVVPFGMYMTLFLLLHVPLVLMLALLMSGNVKVNPEVYEWAWKSLIALLLCGSLVVLTFREQLGPWWVEHTANQAARVDAAQRSDVIRGIDETHAAWLKKHVFIKGGARTIVVRGEDGKQKEVPAEPYIARAQEERDAKISAVQGGKKTDSSTVLGVGVGGLLAGHLIWILLFGGAGLGWYAFKKKDDGKKSSGGGAGTVLVLTALIAGGYYAWNDQSVRGIFTGDKGPSKSAMPSMTPFTTKDFTAQFSTINAQFPLPQHLWHGKQVDIDPKSVVSVDRVDAILHFGEGNTDLDMYLADSACARESNYVPYTCDGTWHTRGTGVGGYFYLKWNQQGSNFLVQLYKEDQNPNNGQNIAEILFVNTKKDGQ